MTAPDHPTHSMSGASGHAAGFGRELTQTSASERYILGKEIDRGGMGIIYRATDTVLGREVAVKVLHEKYGALSEAALRFAGEARITGQLQHPSIPPVHDLGTLSDGRPFLAMKLIKGQTLDQSLKDRPDAAADRGRLVAVFEQICQALAYAHCARRHPPRPEAGQRDGRGVRRSAGHGLGPGQGASQSHRRQARPRPKATRRGRGRSRGQDRRARPKRTTTRRRRTQISPTSSSLTETQNDA